MKGFQVTKVHKYLMTLIVFSRTAYVASRTGGSFLRLELLTQMSFVLIEDVNLARVSESVATSICFSLLRLCPLFIGMYKSTGVVYDSTLSQLDVGILSGIGTFLGFYSARYLRRVSRLFRVWWLNRGI